MRGINMRDSILKERMYIEESDKESYDTLREIEPFNNMNWKEIFMFCMALGYSRKVKQAIKKRKELFFVKDFDKEDEALMCALALRDENSIDVLADRKKIYEIAEEYANAGIKILYEIYECNKFGSFEKEIEKDIFEYYSKIEKKSE